MKKKLLVSSLTYYSKGHSKEYVDNFYKHLCRDVDMTLFNYGGKAEFQGSEVSVPGDSEGLNYMTAGSGAVYGKIIRRFCFSFRLYRKIYSYIRASSSNTIIFMDYEYISLLFFIFFLPARVNPIVCIHSASTSGSFPYRLYKMLFFFVLRKKKNIKYVVNGKVAYDLLKEVVPEKSISLIQYPSELNCLPLNREDAKHKMQIPGKIIISLIGMIRKDKKYEDAIRAYSNSICNDDNRFLLVVAGAPANVTENEVRGWLDKYNIKNCNLNLSYLSEVELNCLFSASDYLLVPYGVGGSSQSGPLSLCRNYNLPAIAPRGGEIGGYIEREKVGYLFDGFDELTLLLDSICSGSLRDTRVFIAKAKEKYSWGVAKKRYIDIF